MLKKQNKNLVWFMHAILSENLGSTVHSVTELGAF
jgi:hypothetical protein